MSSDLTKPEKKLARELIAKGAQQEYANAIKELETLIAAWKNKTTGSADTFDALYKTFRDHNKHIYNRYAHTTGSHYLQIVGILLADGLITQEDIAGFREENREYLNRVLRL